jgi:hypothetical protein
LWTVQERADDGAEDHVVEDLRHARQGPHGGVGACHDPEVEGRDRESGRRAPGNT